MPFIKLQFKPGVNRDMTDYSNEGGWYECDKVRFRSGYPEKIGGWLKSSPTAFAGVCRQMWNYITSYSDNFLALGTNERVYIEAGGIYYDITPFDPALADPNTFAVTNTVALVTVTTTTSLPVWVVTGETVRIAGFVSALGGIPIGELNGDRIITKTGANSFTFTTLTAATSTTSVSGAGYTVQAEIAPGNAIATGGYGWGVSVWGGYIPATPTTPAPRGWGTGTTAAPVNLPQRDWWFDNFDNDLVMNIRNGPAYWWYRLADTNPAASLAAHAITLQAYAAAATPVGDDTYVPTQVMQLLVSQQDRHLLAFGCDFGSVLPNSFDPLLIRWASQDSPQNWVPSATSSAGDLRVSRGSRIVRALPTRQEVLVWTDTHLYTLQFLGTADVFGLQEYADNISVASPRAIVSASNVVYWMGQDKFYAYTGRVETLPCSLRNHVFMNININQADQIVCGTNEQWNEIWWFYPTFNSDYNNAYVIYNHLDQIWYYGDIDRTAWLDTPLRHFPQAANTPITEGVAGSGYVYSHENGTDDDVTPMVSFIQSSDFDIGDGDNFMLTRRMIPDVSFSGSAIDTSPEATLTIRPRNFPGSNFSADPADSQTVTGSTVIQATIGTYTDQVFMRARARQMAFKIQSEALGVQWQLGSPRLDARQDGSR
jgi:hypothetical protein